MNYIRRAMGDVVQRASTEILVVDDECDILPEYQEFFEFAGFSTHTSADPVAAVNIVIHKPDIGVVITDLRMAKLNGARMIRDVRAALPPERRVEFIILTGDASASQFELLPDVPVFLKPADTDALVAAVRAAMSRP